jgi:hypothetical protein
MSKGYTNKVNISTVIRSFYAPGYSSMTLTYFNTYLSLRFYQYDGKNDIGLSHYDLKNGMTATVNYEGASFLYLAAMSILEGRNSEKGMRAVLPCNKAALIFEYKSDQDNQMAAYLTIEKNNQSILFKFKTHQVQDNENGQMITRVIQSGLGAFAMMLEGYLTGIGADLHLSKLPDNFENSQDENQQVSNTNTTTIDNGYQQGNYNNYVSH